MRHIVKSKIKRQKSKLRNPPLADGNLPEAGRFGHVKRGLLGQKGTLGFLLIFILYLLAQKSGDRV
jgi:hypothetical protein